MAFQALIDSQPTVKGQDLLASEADPDETSLVVGVGRSPALRLRHLTITARATWGD